MAARVTSSQHPTIRQITRAEYANISPTISQRLAMPLHFLHSVYYGAWQETAGKKVIYFEVLRGEKQLGCGMAIRYSLPGGLGYLYCPYGPLLQDYSDDVKGALQGFFDGWRDSAVFVRFDTAGQTFHVPSAAAAATASLQPRNEWVLDITPKADLLLQQMHAKARYQIRFGERSNVQVDFEPPSPELLEEFYALLTETSNRNEFGLLPIKTYQAAFATLLESDAYVATARIDGELGAAALILPYAGEAHYIFGCSANRFRKIGPSYVLQWHSIQHAKEIGCVRYNFGGISDDIKSTHLHGVTQFKQRFDGYSVLHPLPCDLVLQPLRYRAFSVYKRLKRH